MFSVSRTDSSIVGRWWWTVDRLLLMVVTVLSIYGIFLVAAASPAVSEGLDLGSFHFVNKHFFFLGLSFSIMILLSLLSIQTIRRLALIGFLVAIVGVILTLLIGSEIKGATRWINLGLFSLQPSEFIKPCFAVVSAWLLSRQIEGHSQSNYIILAGFFILIMVLLFAQPDFGMMMLLTIMLGAQIFMAGLPQRMIIFLLALFFTILMTAYTMLPHVAYRINLFLHPESGDTYQIEKSIESFSHGGFFGVGPGEGTVKMLLPDAHADFIFAVSGEEMGLIWTVLLVMLYLLIIWRSIARTLQQGDLFTVLAVSGLIVYFAAQTMVHMGSSLHMLPTKGMTLPFVSYGGSSLLSMGITMGFILCLTRRRATFSGIKLIRPISEKERPRTLQLEGRVS